MADWSDSVVFEIKLCAHFWMTDRININCKKKWTKCQCFIKIKELQADTQSKAFAAYLILPNRTQSPLTTRPVEN